MVKDNPHWIVVGAAIGALAILMLLFFSVVQGLVYIVNKASHCL